TMKRWLGVITGALVMLMSLIFVVFGFSQFDSAHSSSLEDSFATEKTEETHTVTLITGDEVVVEQLADGQSAINIKPADRNGYEPNFQTMEIDEEHIYVIPEDVGPYISNKLDRELFNIPKLIEQGYDDKQSDEIPLIITFKDHISLQNMSTLNKVFSDFHVLSSINGLATEIPKDGTQNLLDALFAQEGNTLKGTKIFQNNIHEIRLD